MAVGGKDGSKKILLRPKMNLREVTMKYGCSVVFIRHDSAEIWGFRWTHTLSPCSLCFQTLC
jgi:hypothetical protein